jgi:Bucentaur or craniofacial development
MGVISGKKPKMGTLDKSKIDWTNFVQEEGIKEDLETFNKGKEG